MEHPNILPIYDIGDYKDFIYVVTRYIEGLPLSSTIKDGEWSLTTTLQFASRLASAIDYIHSRGVIHGDINPNNVLIGLQDQPYLANFTMTAMREEIIKNKLDSYAGTIGFTAPEIAFGNHVTAMSDLYSFGSVLFYCFTQKYPVLANGENPEDFFQIPSILSYRADLPVGVDVIIKRLTHFQPEKRYSSATEATEALAKVFYSGQGSVEGKIFISYAHKDSDYVHSLAKELRDIGLGIWIDQDIEPGSDWDEAIENALNDCDMMLLITTEASMSSEYVTHEWSYFMGGGKPVYPFIPQSPIPNNIHPRLRRIQHVVGTEDMLNNVARIVDVLAGGTPTKLGSLET